MEEIFYKKGDLIIEQDDIGDCFYVLEEGRVSVTVSFHQIFVPLYNSNYIHRLLVVQY